VLSINNNYTTMINQSLQLTSLQEYRLNEQLSAVCSLANIVCVTGLLDNMCGNQDTIAGDTRTHATADAQFTYMTKGQENVMSEIRSLLLQVGTYFCANVSRKYFLCCRSGTVVLIICTLCV
jgi:hypothetical protein